MPLATKTRLARHLLIADRLIEKKNNHLMKEHLMYVAGLSENKHGKLLAHVKFYCEMIKVEVFLQSNGYYLSWGGDAYKASVFGTRK